jgi:excisionase family DNA binding protein
MTATAVEPQAYRVRDAAAILNISQRSLWRMVATGEVPCVRYGPQTVRILASDLRAFVQSKRTGRLVAA